MKYIRNLTNERTCRKSIVYDVVQVNDILSTSLSELYYYLQLERTRRHKGMDNEDVPNPRYVAMGDRLA